LNHDGRRGFLKRILCSAGLLFIHWPLLKVAMAQTNEKPESEIIDWLTISCYADVIIPRTESTPSAADVHIVNYLKSLVFDQLPRDTLFSRPSKTPEVYRQLQGRLNQLGQDEYSKPFASLSEEQRRLLVEKISRKTVPAICPSQAETCTNTRYSDYELYRISRSHVIQGYFADPKYGGNFDYKSWESIQHTCHLNYPKPKPHCLSHT